VSLTGHKKVFQLGVRELGDFLETYRKKRNSEPPAYIGKKHRLEREQTAGRPCYIISPKNKNRDEQGRRAVLFIHGGGYIFEAHWVHWRAASRIVSALGIPVWLPAYPLFPDHAVPEAGAMLAEVYVKMLEQYQDIIVLGDSAGANLSLSLCHHITKQEKNLPMPKKLILLSPAMITEQDEAMLNAMRLASSHDVLLSMTFMSSATTLFNIDKSRDNYYYSPLYGDFSRFPETRIFSGTFETCFPQIEHFAQRLKAEGRPVEFYPGKEMMHIWPYMPLARECQEALNMIIEIIR
jgi:acetyl esterase/lipase